MSIHEPTFKLIKFDQFGDEQQQLMEKITGVAAVQLVHLSSIASDAASTPLEILDVCSGAGIVPEVLFKVLGQDGRVKRLVSSDVEPKMVELAQKRVEQNGWKGVETQVADGTALPFEDASFDYVFCNFGPQFFPDIDKGLSEAARVLRPSGTYAYTAWTSPGFIPLLIRADPSLTVPLTQPFSKPTNNRAEIPSVLSAAGFSSSEIKVEDVRVPFRFEGVDDFMVGMKKFPGPFFADEERNEKVKQVVREQYGEGPFTLEWVGVAVVARKA